MTAAEDGAQSRRGSSNEKVLGEKFCETEGGGSPKCGRWLQQRYSHEEALDGGSNTGRAFPSEVMQGAQISFVGNRCYPSDADERNKGK
ncbi:hypothetical protein CEXT_741771 [Caerostris extrusa]|uniref:Uncharacterized protein n=1 Tax=Caerostris extrusa TaxID=172846 RepID=A0AAV4W7E5_CAEEX|nr:hypothetical protein CEXT_741771 [Caerostris extrusa]